MKSILLQIKCTITPDFNICMFTYTDLLIVTYSHANELIVTLAVAIRTSQ